MRCRVIGVGFALCFLLGISAVATSVSACTLPPNTYAYPGECVLYNMDGTKYEEPKPAPKPKKAPQAESPYTPSRYASSGYYWAPSSYGYGYGYDPFGHHYYPRYGVGLHLGFNRYFGHHRRHNFGHSGHNRRHNFGHSGHNRRHNFGHSGHNRRQHSGHSGQHRRRH